MTYRHQASAYLLFVIFLLLFGSGYYGQLAPTDAVAYVSIAEKYATGHFSTAINAYWSPLFCWLIAVQLKIGIGVNTAIFCIKIFAGVGTIFFSGKIINHYQWPMWAKLMCLHLVAIWSSLFTLRFATPDSLMACELLLYLYIVIKQKWLSYPLLTGLLGAVLYFTKAFGFYFFPAYLFTLLGWKLFSKNNEFRYLFRKTTIVLISFSLIILPWLITLHHRYQKWIVSSAGGYNHGLMLYGDGSVQPALKSGLLPLPDKSAHNPWEEITLVYHYTDWNPFHSSSLFLLQVKVIFSNLQGVLRYLLSIHVLIGIALAIGVLFTAWYVTATFRSSKINFPFRTSVYVLSFISLYTFGYCIAGVDYRYLYVVYIGMFFIFFDLLILLRNKFPKTELVSILIASSIVVESLFNISKGLSISGNELSTQLAETKILKKIIPPESIIATHATNTTNAMDYWGRWHNHGGLQAYQNQHDAWQALLHYHVQWVFIPATVQEQYTWLYPLSDTVLKTPHWEVFKLKTSPTYKQVSSK